MATYCNEKFEDTTGKEKIVCWRQDKHVHNAALITTLAQWLGTQLGGTWSVRANSYQSGQQKCPLNSLEYTG